MSSTKRVRVTLIKSLAGRLQAHVASVRGLGIKKINHSVEVDATAQNLGMINKVNYLLKVENI